MQKCRVTEHPPKLLKLAADLFADDEGEQRLFCDNVLKVQPYRPALVWMGERPADNPFGVEERQSWQPDFVDRLKRDQRPGQYPLHEQGSYYCMNFSSVFESCVFRVVPEEPELVIDVCASPGGKSVFASRLLHPKRLISNEVIRKRTAQLIANLRRCDVGSVTVTSDDTAVLADQCPGAADLVIVDAPCSGQSMIAKGKHVTAAFHSHVINHNRNRQRRILGNAVKMVKQGGHLAYITCTYARKENEGNLEWFIDRFPEFEALVVPELDEFRSSLTEQPCYRLWPQQGLGAGGFTSILRKTDRMETKGSIVNPRAVWQSTIEQ